jgi:Family of unknown function (DUF5362)
METTELTEQSKPEGSPGLVLTREAQFYLQETGKWANFLAIVGFIMCGLFLILALCIGVVFSMLAKFSPAYSMIPAGIFPLFSVIFILVDVLYFFFPFYLYQFAAKVKKGLAIMDEDELARSLGKLKSFFKLCGIVTIVALCLYALELLAFIIIGTSMHT